MGRGCAVVRVGLVLAVVTDAPPPLLPIHSGWALASPPRSPGGTVGPRVPSPSAHGLSCTLHLAGP